MSVNDKDSLSEVLEEVFGEGCKPANYPSL